MAESALCWMHNTGVRPAAVYVMTLPIGNRVPLCVECCAWWRMDAASRPEDVMVQPVSIEELRAA